MSLVSVAWPDSEPEATIMASLLYAYGIPFFVRDTELSGVFTGAQSDERNRVVLVPEEAAAFTIELLSEIAANQSVQGRTDH